MSQSEKVISKLDSPLLQGRGDSFVNMIHGFKPTFQPQEVKSTSDQRLKSSDKLPIPPMALNFALPKPQILKPKLFEVDNHDLSDSEEDYSRAEHSNLLQKEQSSVNSERISLSEPQEFLLLSTDASKTRKLTNVVVAEVGSTKSNSKAKRKKKHKSPRTKHRHRGTKNNKSVSEMLENKEFFVSDNNSAVFMKGHTSLSTVDSHPGLEDKSEAVDRGSDTCKNQQHSESMGADQRLSLEDGDLCSESAKSCNIAAMSPVSQSKDPASVFSRIMEIVKNSDSSDIHLSKSKEGEPSLPEIDTKTENPGRTKRKSADKTHRKETDLPEGESSSGHPNPDTRQHKRKQTNTSVCEKTVLADAMFTAGKTGVLASAAGSGNTSTASATKPKQKRYRGKQTIFCCSMCPKTFPLNCRLTKHLKTHTGVKPFMCSECGNCFTQNSSLQKHMRTHTGERPYECSYCKRTFSESGTLVRHLRTHTGDKPFACPECDRKFAQKNTLDIHMKIHSGERPHKCPRCDKSFARIRYLSTHMRIHTGDKPYKCPICFKTFAAQSNLKAHQITHSGEKPYVCEVCNKCFSHKKTLQHHTRTHFEDDPYACTICGKSFAYASSLRKHRQMHGAENMFFCEICQRSFCDKFSLKGHMRTHSGEIPFTCPICGKGLYYQSSLKKHMKRHGEESESNIGPLELHAVETKMNIEKIKLLPEPDGSEKKIMSPSPFPKQCLGMTD